MRRRELVSIFLYRLQPFKDSYSYCTSVSLNICIYLEWLESVCGGRGVQRKDCRRPAGWCEVLQSSAHAQLHPPCSPTPAADSPDPPEEILQTSQSEERDNKEIIVLYIKNYTQ